MASAPGSRFPRPDESGPADWIDRQRYPLDAPGTPGFDALVEHARAGLAERGACELPGFLRPGATARMAREARAIAPLAHHHRGAATPYLEIPDPAWPEDHPRRRFHPYGLGAVAWDLIPPDHALHRLYLWEPLMDFVAAVLGEPRLFRYADPLGACNVAVMGEGDELEWHFDQTDFVVSIALQDAEEGGDFLYAPLLRRAGDERYDDVVRVLDGDPSPVRRIPMDPGALLLFAGRHSLHRVTPCHGATPRLVALLSYDTKPGTCGSELLQQARYGRVVRPPAAG